MTTISTPTPVAASRFSSDRAARVACAATAAAAVVPFALAGLSGDTGTEITAGLIDDAVPLTVASIVAVLSSAGLFLAAARLSTTIGGMAGRVAGTAGAAVALMFALYYSTFGAGAVVASQMLQDPTGGLGEGASLLLNLAEITRYAPGFALVVAVFVARGRLPRPVGISAAVLVVLTLVPLTSWVAALLIPLWLGVSAAAVRVPVD